jgi:hypothetical protein
MDIAVVQRTRSRQDVESGVISSAKGVFVKIRAAGSSVFADMQRHKITCLRLRCRNYFQLVKVP